MEEKKRILNVNSSVSHRENMSDFLDLDLAGPHNNTDCIEKQSLTPENS